MKFGLSYRTGLRYIPAKWRSKLNFVTRMMTNFVKSHGFMAVNSLAFSVLLSFVPFVLAIYSLSYMTPLSNRVINKSLKYLFIHFLPQTGNILYQQFQVFLKHSAHLSWFGLSVMILTAFNMLLTFENHLNQLWHIRLSRQWYRSLPIHSLFILACSGIVYGEVSLRLFFVNLGYSNQVDAQLINLLNFVLTVILFSCVYKFIPSIQVKFSSALQAGIVASFGFISSKWGFGYYATHFFRNYDLIYGSLVIVPLFMFWLYLGILNLLFCAQIIYVRDLARYARQKTL